MPNAQALSVGENNQYTMYKCDNTENCTGNCTPVGRKVSFLVDKVRGAVMMTAYENNEFARAVTFKDCPAVFNSENWDCSSESSATNSIHIMETKMTNSTYIARSRVIFPDNGTVTVLNDVCAKL